MMIKVIKFNKLGIPMVIETPEMGDAITKEKDKVGSAYWARRIAEHVAKVKELPTIIIGCFRPEASEGVMRFSREAIYGHYQIEENGKGGYGRSLNYGGPEPVTTFITQQMEAGIPYSALNGSRDISKMTSPSRGKRETPWN